MLNKSTRGIHLIVLGVIAGLVGGYFLVLAGVLALFAAALGQGKPPIASTIATLLLWFMLGAALGLASIRLVFVGFRDMLARPEAGDEGDV